MSADTVVTAALASGIPLLTVAATFGRLSERVDTLCKMLDRAIEKMDETANRHSERLEMHGERIASLEAWRSAREGD